MTSKTARIFFTKRASLFCLPDIEKNDLRISFDKPSATVDLVTLLAGTLNSLKRKSRPIAEKNQAIPGENKLACLTNRSPGLA